MNGSVLLFAICCSSLGWVGSRIYWIVRGHRGQCPFHWMQFGRLHSCERNKIHGGDHRCICGVHEGGSED